MHTQYILYTYRILTRVYAVRYTVIYAPAIIYKLWGLILYILRTTIIISWERCTNQEGIIHIRVRYASLYTLHIFTRGLLA